MSPSPTKPKPNLVDAADYVSPPLETPFKVSQRENPELRQVLETMRAVTKSSDKTRDVSSQLSFMGAQASGIQDTTFQSIKKHEVDIRKNLFRTPTPPSDKPPSGWGECVDVFGTPPPSGRSWW